MKLKNILLKIVNKTDKIFNLSLKESIAKKYLNHLLKDIGKIINLTIDTKNKMISMEILLKGETENLELVIGKYGISKPKNAFLGLLHWLKFGFFGHLAHYSLPVSGPRRDLLRHATPLM